MMMRKYVGWISVGALVLVLGSGCKGEPRLDATSDATIDASVKAMGDSLDDTKKMKLVGVMTVLSLPAIMKASFDRSAPKPTKVTIFKPFHGMTADEIIAKGQTFADAMQNGFSKK
jgi:hypothetical protein